jgi:hypothetical protein
MQAFRQLFLQNNNYFLDLDNILYLLSDSNFHPS